MNEQIKDRIRKLFALGASSNEHEARRALAKAQELMIKYGISEYEESTKQTGAVEHRIYFRAERVPFFERLFFSMLAEEYRCKSYTGRNFILLVGGTKDDIDVCVSAVNYAMTTCRNNWKRYWADLDRKAIRNRDKTKTAYCFGYASGVCTGNQQHRDTNKLPALVVPAEVETHVNDRYKISDSKSTKAEKSIDTHKLHAYRGYVDGKLSAETKQLN